ncbi:MAG TPA: hypothetical protein VEK15_10590 [Vicinamibacteria bacterium]|nr:hypothetical protein [Vicinamibacteria bacterium]
MEKQRKDGARLNIYLPDRAMRRRVKSAAAKHDISISEYCVRAIATQLAKEAQGMIDEEQDRASRLGEAVRRARRFQATVFGGKVFQVSSAELIENARGERGVRSGSRR